MCGQEAYMEIIDFESANGSADSMLVPANAAGVSSAIDHLRGFVCAADLYNQSVRMTKWLSCIRPVIWDVKEHDQERTYTYGIHT